MHESVLQFVATAVTKLGLRQADVVELGSYDVNGTTRPFFDGGTYTGVDMRTGPGVDVVADAHQVPLDDETADVVVCCEMLEHDTDPTATFATIARLLRPDGVLLLTTRSPGYPLHEYPHDLGRFTGPDIEALAEPAGLGVADLIADPQVPGVFAVCRKISSGKGRAGVGPAAARPRRPGTVQMGWCSSGQLEVEFVAAKDSTFASDRNAAHVLIDEPADITGGPRLSTLRTAIVDLFLAGPAEWLWLVDADMAWEPADLYRLLAAADPHRRPVVGGLCFGTVRGGGPFWPVLWRRVDGKLTCWASYPRGQIIPVAAASCAFVLIHRSVFTRLDDGSPEPWFPDQYHPGEGDVIEADIQFFLRCEAAGIPVHVHTGARIRHKKPQFLDEDLFDLVLALQET